MIGGIVPKGRKWSVDTSRWPVLVVTQHAHELSDEERREALDATERALETDSSIYAVIHDGRFAGPVSPKQRAMIAEYGKRSEQRTRQRCVCMVFVFDSIVMRSVLTAIMWLKPQYVETKVVATMEEALTFARAKVEERQARDLGFTPKVM